MKAFSLCLAALLTVSAVNIYAEDQQMIKTLPSGLQYEDVVVGTGAEVKKGDTVEVHYTGWLKNEDGTKGLKFDSSVDRGDKFSFKVGAGRVIKGWDEGLVGMRVGGKRILIIPANLGYGQMGAGHKIPGGATLVFDIELFGTK